MDAAVDCSLSQSVADAREDILHVPIDHTLRLLVNEYS